MVGSPKKAFSLFKLLSRAWHSLQSGIYMSSPPISFFESLLAVLNVKLALSLQSLQMAVNFLIFSHLGKRAKMFGKVPLKKVPCRELMITIFPLLAAFSANSQMSVKNWPSSTPITSNSFHESLRSKSLFTGNAAVYCPLWVEILNFPPYLLSAENLTLITFFSVISCLRQRRMSSVVLPANMHPMMSSILPLWIGIGLSTAWARSLVSVSCFLANWFCCWRYGDGKLSFNYALAVAGVWKSKF